MYKKSGKTWVKHFDFMLIDLCTAQVSFVLSYMLRHGIYFPYASPIYRKIAILIIILQICIAFFTEPYSQILKRDHLKEFKASVKYNSTLIMAVLVVIFIMKLSGEYSRITIFYFWIINCIRVFGTHVLRKNSLRKRVKDEKKCRYMYLVTDKKFAINIVKDLLNNKYNNFILKGVIVLDSDGKSEKIAGIPVVANADTMLGFIKTNVVDEIFINLWDDNLITKAIADYCLDMGIIVHINMGNVSGHMPNAGVEKINGLTVVTTSISAATFRQIVLKRMIDICGSLAGLVVTGIVSVFIVPLIYMQSPGPVFFTQERVGKNGRRFKLYKFRSMYMDAEERKKELMLHNKMDGFMFKMDNDPRITPIGRFIRKTSMDELPQFFNVLKGDMSLVGTRPPTVDEYERYALHHKKRLAIKPGLTGLWQVSGRNNITDFEKVVALDTQYIQEWTLGLDLKILLKTVKVVLRREGSS